MTLNQAYPPYTGGESRDCAVIRKPLAVAMGLYLSTAVRSLEKKTLSCELKLFQMNIIEEFITEYGIQPGYVIRSKANYWLAVLDHWCMYLGKMVFPDSSGTLRYQNVFAANFPPRPQFFGEETALEFLNTYHPVEISNCYSGQCNQQLAVWRAVNIVGANREEYNLLWNNCQDFVKEATTGTKGSYQRNILLGAVVGVGLLLLANRALRD